MNIRILKKGDLILLLSVGIIIVLLLLWNNFSVASGNNHLIAEVRKDGELVKKIDLNEVSEPEYIYFEEGIRQTIVAEKGRIRFLESDCRDKICVKAGWLTKAGDKAVCMPAKTIIKINGESRQTDSIAF
jgi:hypothetical protein